MRAFLEDGDLVIELDEPVVSWNTLYSSKHWAVRKKLAQRVHDTIALALRASFGDEYPQFEYPVEVLVESYSKRPIDSDNVCAKLYIDGLVGTVIQDDSPPYVQRVVLTSRKAGENKLIIRVHFLGEGGTNVRQDV